MPVTPLPIVSPEFIRRVIILFSGNPVGDKAEIATVQLALSEISIPSGKDGKGSEKKLWSENKITGKHSAALLIAVLRFQKFKGIREKGVFKLNPNTIKAIILAAPRLKSLKKTFLGLISKLNLAKVKLNSEAEARRIRLHGVMPNKDADALAKIILSAGKAGYPITAQVYAMPRDFGVKIDRRKGKIEVGLSLPLYPNPYKHFTYPNPEFVEALKTIILNSNRWELVQGSHLRIRTKETYKFLISDGKKTTGPGLDFFGVNKGQYNADPRYAAIIDSGYQILRTRGIVAGEAGISADDEKKLIGTRKRDFLLLAQMMHPLNKTSAVNLVERVFSGHGDEISGRDLLPLYAMGFEVAAPVFIVASLGLKVQFIFDKNAGKGNYEGKEYLYVEFTAAAGQQYKGSFGLEPIRKTIKDFPVADVKFFAELQGGLKLGPVTITLKVKPELPKAAAPVFFEGASLGNILGFEGFAEGKVEDFIKNNKDAQSLDDLRKKVRKSLSDKNKEDGPNNAKAEKPKGPKKKNTGSLNVLKWDVGTFELNVELSVSSKFGREVSASAGVKFSAFIPIDTDVWDPFLYALVPGDLDIEKVKNIAKRG
ncbi:MAG: hypothetical protein COB37_11520 [Kordiimonadales bacterium]|nr:MAG: hypothetical protein COB37_11520 [Kordiimonadales bacterium]